MASSNRLESSLTKIVDEATKQKSSSDISIEAMSLLRLVSLVADINMRLKKEKEGSDSNRLGRYSPVDLNPDVDQRENTDEK